MRGLLGALTGLVIGGVLVLIASGRVWSTVRVHGPGAPSTPVSVTGHAVEPSLPALAIALLALAAAVIAARGWMRRAVGVLIVVVGGLGVPAHGTANGWWVVAALGGLVALLVGVAVTVRSGRWAAMGRKYEAPQGDAVAADPAVTAWDALDRGEDPTE